MTEICKHRNMASLIMFGLISLTDEDTFYIICQLDIKHQVTKSILVLGDLFSILDSPANVFQGTETPKFKYKSILERCYCFLLEEIEPSYFLKNEDVSVVFASIRADVKEQTNRAAKNRLLLEHLKKQPEDTIQLVLEKLEKRNSYIYRQLFPKTENFQDIGKYTSKGDFLKFKVCI